MFKIAGEDWLTSQEVVDNIGGDFSLKRLEYLRSIKLVPPPMKVGHGDGTKGYYPPYVVELIRHSERDHKVGKKSYPDIIIARGDEIETIEIKYKRDQKSYLTEREIRKQLGRSLISGKQPEEIIKQAGATKLTLEDITKEMNELKQQLKSLFSDSEDMSMVKLSRIKQKISKIENLEAKKDSLNQVSHYIRALGGQVAGARLARRE